MALTTKAKLFVKHYISSQNATESAKKAGYSAKTAYSAGHRLLKSVEVQELISAELELLKAKADISNEEIIQILGDIAREGSKDADRIASAKVLAQIKGMLKENTTSIAIINKELVESENNFSNRLQSKNLQKKALEEGQPTPHK